MVPKLDSPRFRGRVIGASVAVTLLVITGCSSGSKAKTAKDSSPSDASASEAAGSDATTQTSAPGASETTVTLPVLIVPPTTPRGCLTNGSLSGGITASIKDLVTLVNTQNVGENAPDAYYNTQVDKNTVAYFAFGKKGSIVINGDGSWTGETGSNGTIEIAPDGSGATVKATIEGSDVNGKRATPVVVDLVTKCGIEIPVTVGPAPVTASTQQPFTEEIVEQTDPPANTPS